MSQQPPAEQHPVEQSPSEHPPAAPSPADRPEPDAVARARATRVVVVGGGVAGLVAALEWARIGATVTVLEASDRFGGAVETVTLDGLPVDLVADALPHRAAAHDAAARGAPAIDALLDELGLRELIEPAAQNPVWVVGAGGTSDAAPLPTASVLGIPANPWADDVRRIIGWRGAWRAYLDRLRPPLTIGHERSLGRLVRTRMGDRVADRLVAPLTRGLYGVEPDDIDVEIAAPGLSTALTRTGSLAGAVAALLPDDPTDHAPTRVTLRGGLAALPGALVARLRDLGAQLRTDAEVVSLARSGGAWAVGVSSESAGEHAPDPLAADVVVMAVGGAPASGLLAGAGIDVPAPSVRLRDVVTLVVDAPALDASPRGRAVYPIAASLAIAPAAAVALVDATADWPWLAAAAGPGRHVLRVSLTPADSAAAAIAATPVASDANTDTVLTSAARAAEHLLGVELGEPRAAAHRRIALELPASALDHAARTADVRRAAARHPGLSIVGAWMSGSGLAQVIADAIAESDRVRSAVLWGRPRWPRADHGADE